MTLKLADVRVHYGSVCAVDAFTDTVEPGEWLCLIGPNGAGKTSVLHAIAGLVAYEGSIEVDQRRLDRMRPSRRAKDITLVPQRPEVPHDMSVFDYVLLGRTPHVPWFAFESADDRSITGEVMERLELGELAGRLLPQLSGGELQRVLLARALAQQTPVLLLDEPTSALDLGHQQHVLQLVDDARASLGLAVISTMHDLTLAGGHADRLSLLHEGGVVASGRPDEVLTEATLSRYYGAEIEVLAARDGTIAVVPLRSRVGGAGTPGAPTPSAGRSSRSG